MHVFDTHGLCSGDFLDLSHVCIMPTNETYELNFFAHCNKDEVIRKDIEHNFFNLEQPIYSFDIKPFSLTSINDYKKVIDMLRVHLDMHPCCIHISNFGFHHLDDPQYEKIDSVRGIVDLILREIIKSNQNHVVEFHLKCYDYDDVYDSKYYHQQNGYVMQTFRMLQKHSNIRQVIITESSYDEEVTTERERSIAEHKPAMN